MSTCIPTHVRSHFLVISVAWLSHRALPCMSTCVYTQARSHILVTAVARLSHGATTCVSTSCVPTKARSHFMVTVLAAKRIPLLRNMQHLMSLHSKGGCTVDRFFSFFATHFFLLSKLIFCSTAILVSSILSIV